MGFVKCGKINTFFHKTFHKTCTFSIKPFTKLYLFFHKTLTEVLWKFHKTFHKTLTFYEGFCESFVKNLHKDLSYLDSSILHYSTKIELKIRNDPRLLTPSTFCPPSFRGERSDEASEASLIFFLLLLSLAILPWLNPIRTPKSTHSLPPSLPYSYFDEEEA